MTDNVGSWTDLQRKRLFSEMHKVNMTAEEMEGYLKFPMSELSKEEASLLIGCFEGNKDLSEIVKEVRKIHTQRSEEKVEQKLPVEAPAVQKTVPAPKEPPHEVQEVTTEPLDWSAIHSNPEQYVRRLNYLYLHLLQKGTDYGIIPGTQKPTLYKAGAELLAMNLGLTTETTENTELKETFGTPMIICNAHTEVSWNGKKIADGYGSCSSGETKYAFRWYSENKLPKNVDKEILYSEEGQYGKRYRVPSSLNEIMDVSNTVKKMAIKRAYIDAVLRATGASRIFTQDLEDMAIGDKQ